jgi:hypothetical protein
VGAKVKVCITALLFLSCLVEMAIAGSSDEKELVRVRLEQALIETEQLPSLSAQLGILEEAQSSLKQVSQALVQRLLSTVHRRILESPEILSARDAPRRDAEGLPSRIRPSEDRDDLFRRFARIAAHYDPELAKSFIEAYAKRHPAQQQAVPLWEAAYDLLQHDFRGSVGLARLAAQSGDLPVAGLLYLEHARLLSPDTSDPIAMALLARMHSLSPNERLLLLTYVVPDERVPSIVSARILPRVVQGRPPLSGSAAKALLAQQSVRTLLGAEYQSPPELLVLGLWKERLSAYPELAAALDRKLQSQMGALPPAIQQSIRSELERWVTSTDLLQRSVEASQTRFERSGDQKYRDRSILMQALNLARSGHHSDAVTQVDQLPSDVRANAKDAVLLYAANAVKEYEAARQLTRLARIETRNQFIVGYALLRSAQLAGSKARGGEDEVLPLLNEIAQLTRNLRSPSERMSLHLGSAYLWTQYDSQRAYAELASILKELASDESLDGVPFVNMILKVGGTSVEFSIPTGQSSLYTVVRQLARNDMEATLSTLSGMTRDVLRLRSTVAACAAYLSVERDEVE